MIANSATSLLERIARAQHSSPAASPSVTLVGACKGQGDAAIHAAVHAGITHFGENRVQEAAEKWPALKKHYPQTQLHLIGPLQTNKVTEAVALFDVIQTVDREKLAVALKKEMDGQGRQLPCFIQVNTGDERQKSGIGTAEANDFIAFCLREAKLPVVGLMCVPPVEALPAPHFALLRALAEHHGLTRLSMGMSGDFETAVRLGATHVRIGTALFGKRG